MVVPMVSYSPMIYLACPYSHPDQKVREARFRLSAIISARMIKEDKLVFSRLTHSHPINVAMQGTADGFETWRRLDLAMIDRCQCIAVVIVEGWDKSKGVSAEIDYGLLKGMPVWHYNPSPEDLVQAGFPQ